MNYPKQSSFEAEHTTIIGQSTSEIRDEKGSGIYGEDVAQELFEQSEIRKDTIIQYESPGHELARGLARRTLEESWGQKQIHKNKHYTGYDERIGFYDGYPDLTSEGYIVECKSGMEESDQFDHIMDQGKKYPIMAEKAGKKIIFWFLRRPPSENPDQAKLVDIIKWLIKNGITVLYAEDYYDLKG